MTKLNHTEARILRNLVNNAGSMRWSDMSESDRRTSFKLERKEFCVWLRVADVAERLEITPKGIEALKGPIE